MQPVAMSGSTRALLILGLVAAAGAIIALALMDRRRSVARAEKILAALCSQTGLHPVATGASALKYFRDKPSVGSPLRMAAGRVDGVPVEICFVPIVKRSEKGRTLVGTPCPGRLGVEVGLSARDAASGITHSLFGVAGGAGARPLFGPYDGWGPPADLQRVFTPAVQSMTLAFPRQLEQVLVYGQEVVLVWRQIEDDVGVMKQAFRLAASLCEAASSSSR
jgi:hypothetical protein